MSGGTSFHVLCEPCHNGSDQECCQTEEQLDEEETSETKAQQAGQVRKRHGFLGCASSSRLTLILRSRSSRRVSSWCPTASIRQEISSSPERSGPLRKPATHSPACLRCHSCRERRGEYRNARSDLRRPSRPFLKSRSSVVITVV